MKQEKYLVYGFTDHWCQHGFPGCDGAFDSLEAAKAALENLASRGFRFRSERTGYYGWINDGAGKTVFPETT